MDMLRAEEKRWLVVGICLSKVLTPAMRSVIRQEMHQLYQNMVLAPTCIHSQTLSSYLKRLPPSTARLNYANINNNAAQPSNHSYDYCVKDEVSYNPPLEHSCISLIVLKIVNDFFSYFELLLIYPWRFCDIGINLNLALRTIWPFVH